MSAIRIRHIRCRASFESWRRISQVALVTAAALSCNSKRSALNEFDSSTPLTAVAPNLLAESLWSDNQTYVYGLELSSVAGLAGAVPMAQYQMQGNLVVAARKASPTSVQLAIHVAGARFSTENKDAQPKYDALSTELLQPYLITLSQGAIVEERIAKDTSAFAESILRYLGALFQLRAAAGQRGVAATERDLTGVYHATYDANAAGNELERTKLRYEPLSVAGKGPAANGATLATNVKSSKATLRLSGNSLQSIELKDNLGAPVSNGSIMSSSTSLKLTLKRASATVTVLPWDSLIRESVATEPGRLIAKPGKPSQFDDLRIGDYTFDKALSEMAASAKRTANRAAKNAATLGRTEPVEPSIQKQELAADERVFIALTALLRRDAANVDRAVQLINKNDITSKLLMDALSSAGTPNAQAALVGIVENGKIDGAQRQRAALALARVANATPDTVGAFTRLLHVHGFETTACYGLGTLSRRLRDGGDFATADTIVETLIKELKESKNEDWSVVVLRGIANSGNGKAFDTVEPFLKEPSARLREAAVASIRLMLEPRVETVLQSVIANETDDSVRVAALDACGMHPMTPALLQTVTSAGLKGKATRVRQRAIQVLAKWASQSEQAASALKSIVALETNPNVLREAETAESRVEK